MRKLIQKSAALCGILAMTLLGTGMMLAGELPDDFSVPAGQGLSIASGLPVKAVSSGTIAVDGRAGEKYRSDLKLFGVVEIKSVNVSVIEPDYVAAGGGVFGVKLYTEGVMVIGLSDVDAASGARNPAYEAGIRKGDVITSVEGSSVNTNSEIGKIFEASEGRAVKVSARRGSTGYETEVKAEYSMSAKTYKAGMWVRDSTAGIGTITYYDTGSGVFGGLGHAVCDVDTGELLPLHTGQAVKADLFGVVKGSRGSAGELEGTLEDTPLGTLALNSETGLYGVVSEVPAGAKRMPVAMSQQVHPGRASIISTVDASGAHEYAVTIENVDYTPKSAGRNMVIKVTDKTLIARTGGIVQGMSGSPIIQDGRLAGAVTHVLVNDPLTGYGIFAENMRKTSKTLVDSFKKAS